MQNADVIGYICKTNMDETVTVHKSEMDIDQYPIEAETCFNGTTRTGGASSDQSDDGCQYGAGDGDAATDNSCTYVQKFTADEYSDDIESMKSTESSPGDSGGRVSPAHSPVDMNTCEQIYGSRVALEDDFDDVISPGVSEQYAIRRRPKPKLSNAKKARKCCYLTFTVFCISFVTISILLGYYGESHIVSGVSVALDMCIQ